MRLTAYGGANEIGGNKILVEWEDHRIFFDFGLSFNRLGQYYEEYLQPRGAALGLKDFLRMELLPPLQGIYRPDLYDHCPDLLEEYSSHPAYRRLDHVDGVFLSHAHLDHNGHLGFLRSEIPVYAGTLTAVLGKAIQDCKSASVGDEIAYFKCREDAGDGTLSSRGDRTGRTHHVLTGDRPSQNLQQFFQVRPSKDSERVLPPLQPCRGDSLPFATRYWPVDHSIPGAGAWAIETDAGWVVYTGDIRLHGRRAEQTRRFAEEAGDLNPAVLLIEGTRIYQGEDGTWRDPSPTPEAVVRENCLEAVRSEEGLVVADFGARNLERLNSFREIARETGRQLVVTTKDAYLLDAIARTDSSFSGADVDGIRIYVAPTARSYRDYWEREVLGSHEARLIYGEEIAAAPSEFVVCFSFWDIKHLVDLDPDGGTWLYSSSEAYDEEMAIDQRRLMNWLDHFGLRPVGGLAGQPEDALTEGFHASGHIHPGGIEEVVDTINPEWIVPIHTPEGEGWRGAEWFVERWGDRVRVPEYGGLIRFE